ncbi:MAG TPA: universal stress protein [Solirubrobacteraceae bacterium]|nr:universal stress protein [Solirubrobacteraceae bacterium]
MSLRAIVSYDDSANDHDALALGRILREAGASLSLAYVRHFPEADPLRELAEQRKAEDLLERGAEWLGNPDLERHVVLSTGTGDGLAALAEREEADVVIFGSDAHTAPGHVAPGTSARRLLEGGPAAVAIAPAALRELVDGLRLRTVAAIGDASASATAHGLVDRFAATFTPDPGPAVDFLVVGSRPEAPEGRVLVSSASEYAIELATCPVLVVRRGAALSFGARALATA